MAKTSDTQNELRQPDAFQKVGAPVRDWLISHERTLVIAAGVVVLALFGAALASHFSQRSQEKAAQALARSLAVLSRPVGTDPAAAAQGKPPFATERERDEAVRKELTEFRQTYSGTHAATTAALPLAQTEYRLGNHDAALALYDEFLKDAPGNDPLRASALEGRGYALEAKGQLDQALAAFDQLTQSPRQEFLVGMGEYHRARILLQQGKQTEAVQALQGISTKHPNTAAARLASERIKVLASQGVAIPAPPARTEADAK